MSKKNRRKKFTYFCFRINFTKTLRLYMATNGKKHNATPFLYFLLLRFLDLIESNHMYNARICTTLYPKNDN